VIEPKDEKGTSHRLNIKIGELKKVDANLVKTGEAYEWHIEQENKAISDRYGFRVLNKDESDNILSQLAELERKYGKDSLPIIQAWYLQHISDIYPEFDFYAESIRLIYSSKGRV